MIEFCFVHVVDFAAGSRGSGGTCESVFGGSGIRFGFVFVVAKLSGSHVFSAVPSGCKRGLPFGYLLVGRTNSASLCVWFSSAGSVASNDRF